MKQDYIPSRDGDLNSSKDNFLGQADAAAATLGIPAADLDAVKALITNHQKKYAGNTTAQAAAKSATSALKTSRSATVKEVRRLAARFKTAPAYTEEIGSTLRIIGIDSNFDPATVKPHLKVDVQGENAVITFNNPREVDGVKIFSKRGEETVFTFLAIDKESPYEDNRPNLVPGTAEQPSYYAFYYDDDQIIRQQSDQVNISITK